MQMSPCSLSPTLETPQELFGLAIGLGNLPFCTKAKDPPKEWCGRLRVTLPLAQILEALRNVPGQNVVFSGLKEVVQN